MKLCFFDRGGGRLNLSIPVLSVETIEKVITLRTDFFRRNFISAFFAINFQKGVKNSEGGGK